MDMINMTVILVFIMAMAARAVNADDDVTLMLPHASRDSQGHCHLPDAISFEILRHGKYGGWKVEVTRNDVIRQSNYVYVMSSDGEAGDNLQRVEIERKEHEAVQAYHNHNDGAAFTVKCTRRNEQGQFFVLEGSLYKDDRKYRLSPSLSWRSSLKLLPSHVIASYRLEEIEEHHPDDSASYIDLPEESHDSMKLQRKEHSLVKRATTTEYFLDVLPVVDYSMYKRWLDKSGNDAMADIKAYLENIFAALDMRLATLDLGTTQLKARMVDPVYLTDEASSPYNDSLKEVSNTGRVQLGAIALLDSFRRWLPTNSSLPTYDHAMLFLSYDIYGGEDGGIKFNVTKGLAYPGTLCKTDGSSSSIVEDKGAYQSEGVVAHELGHSLGSKHDGQDNNCKPENRFLMSDRTYPATSSNKFNPWKFSSCSSENINKLIEDLESDSTILATCLVGQNGQALDNNIQTVTVREQCVTFYGKDAFACRGARLNFSEICDTFYCRTPDTSICLKLTAATGTCCGNQKKCIEGHCQAAETNECPMDDDCPLGDQPGVILNGKTCSELESSYCYGEDIRTRCCSSCKNHKRQNEACLYGDKQLGCEKNRCSESFGNGLAYSYICCGTCNHCVGDNCNDQQTVTITDGSDAGTYTCQELVELSPAYCYKSQISNASCAVTCEQIRDKVNIDCPFGDAASDCATLEQVGKTCEDEQRKFCCDTCMGIDKSLETTTVTPSTIQTTVPETSIKTTVPDPNAKTTETISNAKTTETISNAKTTETISNAKTTETIPNAKTTETIPNAKTTDTDPNAETNEQDDDDKSTLYIGLGAGGGLLLLILLVICMVCCRRASKKPAKAKQKTPNHYDRFDDTRQDRHPYNGVMNGNNRHNPNKNGIYDTDMTTYPYYSTPKESQSYGNGNSKGSAHRGEKPKERTSHGGNPNHRPRPEKVNGEKHRHRSNSGGPKKDHRSHRPHMEGPPTDIRMPPARSWNDMRSSNMGNNPYGYSGRDYF